MICFAFCVLISINAKRSFNCIFSYFSLKICLLLPEKKVGENSECQCKDGDSCTNIWHYIQHRIIDCSFNTLWKIKCRWWYHKNNRKKIRKNRLLLSFGWMICWIFPIDQMLNLIFRSPDSSNSFCLSWPFSNALLWSKSDLPLELFTNWLFVFQIKTLSKFVITVALATKSSSTVILEQEHFFLLLTACFCADSYPLPIWVLD